MKIIQMESPWMRNVVLIATILLLGGAAAFLCSEWGPGIGDAAVANMLVSNGGLALFGASLLLFGAMFAAIRFQRSSRLAPEERREALKELGRQTLVTCLNVLVYGGIFILAVGSIGALDAGTLGTTIIVLIVWACCIAAFVLYRKHRKAHRMHYGLIGSAALVLLFFLLGTGALVGSVSDMSGAIRDLERGPAQANAFLVDAKIDHPYWKHARILQARHVLTFFTANEERIVLEVPEGDVERAKTINDLGNFVHLVYYPDTQVFCSAERWEDGRQTMGDDLLERLNEEYDFTL